MAAKRLVSVRILGHEYRIRSDGDPAALARVAELVDETMAKLRDRSGVIDSLDLAIMAALNLARDLVAERAANQGSAAQDERVRALTERVEGLLRGAGPPAG
jgi:cell division protein ZapA (FtsZ GTPase activity inhibitor)